MSCTSVVVDFAVQELWAGGFDVIIYQRGPIIITLPIANPTLFLKDLRALAN